MASEVKTNKISPSTSTTVTLGDASDLFQLPASAEIDIASGATLDVNGTIDFTGATVTGLTTGKILQVVSAAKTDTFSHNTTSWVDITDMTVSITPAATSSKIYVSSSISTGQKGTAAYFWIQLVRDSTEIFIGDAAGSRNRVTESGGTGADTASMSLRAISYVDSPNTTSSTTYKIQMKCQNTDTQYINRSYTDTDNATYARGASSIIVMEIGA